MNKRTPDKYDIEARYIPAILCSAPFVAVGFYFIASIDTTFWSKLFALSFGGVTLAVALYKLAEQTCRLAGKYLETRLFKKGLYLPTTDFLLAENDSLSSDRKQEIYNKIKKLFKVELAPFATDTDSNRRRIHEIVGQIRKYLFGKSDMVLQRNIQFGFFRNLVGGTILAIPASIITIVLALVRHLTAAIGVGTVLLVCYLLVISFAIPILRFLANQYAITLFEEFIGI